MIRVPRYSIYDEKNKIVSDWEKWIEFLDIHKCTYKHIPVLVSIHNHNGISSVISDSLLKERAEIITKYYGENIHTLKTKKYIKFLKIPLMKIVKNFDETSYYLFGFLQIAKKIAK